DRDGTRWRDVRGVDPGVPTRGLLHRLWSDPPPRWQAGGWRWPLRAHTSCRGPTSSHDVVSIPLPGVRMGVSVGRAEPPGAGLRRALHPAAAGERRGTPLAALLDDLHRLPGSLEAEDGPHALLLGAQVLLAPLPHRLLEDRPDLRQVGETILGRTEV